jgi:hypothetical protein
VVFLSRHADCKHEQRQKNCKDFFHKNYTSRAHYITTIQKTPFFKKHVKTAYFALGWQITHFSPKDALKPFNFRLIKGVFGVAT